MFQAVDPAYYSSLPCAAATDLPGLLNYTTTLGNHPNQFTYANRTLVSTFAGEGCTFGQTDVDAGWAAFKAASQTAGIPVRILLRCTHVRLVASNSK